MGGLLALWLVARSKWIERQMLHVMGWALRRWTDLEAYDFVELLELAGGYRVRRIGVDPGDWVEGRRLDDLKLFDEGITVLGIHRPDGSYLGVPRGETKIRAGDRLVLYGRDERLRELEDRRIGEAGSGRIARPWPTTSNSAGSESRPEEAMPAGRDRRTIAPVTRASAPLPRRSTPLRDAIRQLAGWSAGIGFGRLVPHAPSSAPWPAARPGRPATGRAPRAEAIRIRTPL